MKTNEDTNNRPVLVISTSLLIGIALASIVWMFLLPHRHGIPESVAKRMGFKQAAEYNQVQKVEQNFFKDRVISKQGQIQAREVFQQGSAHAKAELLAFMGQVWAVPNEEPKVIALIGQVRNDPDVGVRSAIVLCLHKMQGQQAKQMLRDIAGSDPDQRIRQMAEAALTPQSPAKGHKGT